MVGFLLIDWSYLWGGIKFLNAWWIYYSMRKITEFWGQDLWWCCEFPRGLPGGMCGSNLTGDNLGTAVTPGASTAGLSGQLAQSKPAVPFICSCCLTVLSGMLAHCVVTNSSNNLPHSCHCLTTLVGRKETFWLSVLWFQAPSNSHLHALWRGRLTRGRQERQKEKQEKECNVLNGLNYIVLGGFKANRLLTCSFIFLSKQSSTSHVPLKVLAHLPVGQRVHRHYIYMPCSSGSHGLASISSSWAIRAKRLSSDETDGGQAAPLATGFLLITFDAKSSSKIAKITRGREAAWSEQH